MPLTISPNFFCVSLGWRVVVKCLTLMVWGVRKQSVLGLLDGEASCLSRSNIFFLTFYTHRPTTFHRSPTSRLRFNCRLHPFAFFSKIRTLTVMTHPFPRIPEFPDFPIRGFSKSWIRGSADRRIEWFADRRIYGSGSQISKWSNHTPLLYPVL